MDLKGIFKDLQDKDKWKNYLDNDQVEKYAEDHPDEIYADDYNQFIEINGEQYIKCVVCNEWYHESNMKDTTETFQIGMVCDGCYEQCKEDR